MTEPELDHDRPVEAALRGLEDPCSRTEAEWTRLEARISRRARPMLRRLRLGRPWVEETARWARAAIPLAVAAGLAALFAISRFQVGTATTDVPPPDGVSFYGALASADSESELVSETLGTMRPDLVLDEAEAR